MIPPLKPKTLKKQKQLHRMPGLGIFFFFPHWLARLNGMQIPTQQDFAGNSCTTWWGDVCVLNCPLSLPFKLDPQLRNFH